MKAELKNQLLKAMCETLDPRLKLEAEEVDGEGALLWRQADALSAVGDLLEDDPAGIIGDVTAALEKLNNALEARQKRKRGPH